MRMTSIHEFVRFSVVSLLSLLASAVVAGLLALPVGLAVVFLALDHYEGGAKVVVEPSAAAAALSLTIGWVAFLIAFFVFLAFTLPRMNKYLGRKLLGRKHLVPRRLW